MKDSKPSTSSGSCLLNLDPHFLFSVRSDSLLLFESPNGLCDTGNFCLPRTMLINFYNPGINMELYSSMVTENKCVPEPL